jgi:general secretion pathway protein D
MPFCKGLARICSGLLSVLLLLQTVAAPTPVWGKNRKSEKLLKEAQLAEVKGDYDEALKLYEQALAIDPRDTAYRLGLDRVRFQAAQKMVDRGEKLRSAGKLEEALALFQKAFALDPSSSIAEQRMRQTFEMIQREKKTGPAPTPEDRGMTAADRVRQQNEERLASLMDSPVLKPIQREIVNLKMNNQPAKVLFETVAKMAGINVMFDPDFISQSSGKNLPVDFQNTTLEEALDYLSILTKAYWKPISTNAIYITLDNPQKRRDYEDYIVKVFYLQHALEPQELQEIANAIRVVGECRKVVPYAAQMAVMVRCTADQVALVQKILNDMDKPRAELMLDVYILEANRTRTRSLAATIANGARPGLNQSITFRPSLATSTGTSNGGTTTSTATPSTNISLASLNKLSLNDFSINMPGAFLNAVLDDRTTRVLQNPQVRTVDNKKASLRIGDRYPYATGSFNVGTGVGVGSPIASTQFQFAEVGVNIDITPKIHGNEEISLRVEVEVSNIRDQVDIGGVRQPVIGQRKIGEDIRIREGEVNVMGGLMANSRSRNLSGLPWLVTLPGLGWLFGTDGDDRSDSELLVVLVPHLVRAPELTELNLRGVSTGTDQQVKVSFNTRDTKATAPAGSPPAAAPAQTPTAAPMTMPVAPQVVMPAKPPIAIPQQPAVSPAGPPPGVPIALNNRLVLEAPSGQHFLGGPVEITLRVEQATDLAHAPIQIDYDRQLLRLVSVNSGGLLSSDGTPESLKLDLTKGDVDVARAPGASGVNGNGALVKLVFMTLAKGEAAVRVAGAQLENSKKEMLMPATLPEIKVKID